MQQLKVTRKFDASGARLIGFAPPVWGAGKVYYVDSRSWGIGSDANSGLDPDQPLAKIQTAIGKCTAAKNDYVICLDSYDNDIASILVNKAAVHIIGVGAWNHAAPFAWLKIAATGALPVFTLVQNDGVSAEIAGFALAADSSHPCITTSVGSGVQMSFCHLHHLSFAASGDTAFLAQDGFTPIDAAVASGILIEDCVFGDEITRDGIRFKYMTNGLIRNCLFRNVGVKGVNCITGGGAGGMPDVLNNQFRANHGAAEGWAITSVAGTNGLIDGNHASADFATADNNPYLDTADGNQWGVNWSFNAVSAPATT